MAKENTEIVNKKLSEVNKLIEPYQLAYVEFDDCVFLERNAHYMDKEVFEQLVDNVAEDKFLSQLPFALKRDDGKFLIMSGNHRVKAAGKAGLENILLLYVSDIDKDKQLAYQLSHNALVGKDDVAILKELYSELESLEEKKYSGLSELNFPDFDITTLPTINEKDIELHEIKFLFTPARAEKVKVLLDVLEKQNLEEENCRIIHLPFKEFIRELTEFKKQMKIKSSTVAFLKMLDIVQTYLENEKDNEDKGS